MTDAEIVAAVRERIADAHKSSVEYRRVGPKHIMTDGYRRYWDERIALDSLLPIMTLADLLASEHLLVREAALFVIGAPPADWAGNGPHDTAALPAPLT